MDNLKPGQLTIKLPGLGLIAAYTTGKACIKDNSIGYVNLDITGLKTAKTEDIAGIADLYADLDITGSIPIEEPEEERLDNILFKDFGQWISDNTQVVEHILKTSEGLTIAYSKTDDGNEIYTLPGIIQPRLSQLGSRMIATYSLVRFPSSEEVCDIHEHMATYVLQLELVEDKAIKTTLPDLPKIANTIYEEALQNMIDSFRLIFDSDPEEDDSQ